MPGLTCDSALCDFVSADGTLEQKLQHLAIHAQTAHHVQQQHQGGGVLRGKVHRSTLQPVSNLESWEFFRYERANYKTAMGITEGHHLHPPVLVPDQGAEALPPEIQPVGGGHQHVRGYIDQGSLEIGHDG